jgi:hypothetical protein
MLHLLFQPLGALELLAARTMAIATRIGHEVFLAAKAGIYPAMAG